MKRLLIVLSLVFLLSGCTAFTTEVKNAIPDEYITEDEMDQTITERLQEFWTNYIEVNEPQEEPSPQYFCEVDGRSYEVNTFDVQSNTFIYQLIGETTIHARSFDVLSCAVIEDEE